MVDYIRRFWRFCCLACCVGSVIYIFVDDPASALAFGIAATAFFALSEWRYPDLGDP